MCRKTHDAWYEVCWPKKVVLCLVLVPVLAIQTASNYWLLILNVAAGHRLLHIVWMV